MLDVPLSPMPRCPACARPLCAGLHRPCSLDSHARSLPNVHCPPPVNPPAAQASGADKQLLPIQRVWVYMPLMHSEELADQDVRAAGAWGPAGTSLAVLGKHGRAGTALPACAVPRAAQPPPFSVRSNRHACLPCPSCRSASRSSRA